MSQTKAEVFLLCLHHCEAEKFIKIWFDLANHLPLKWISGLERYRPQSDISMSCCWAWNNVPAPRPFQEVLECMETVDVILRSPDSVWSIVLTLLLFSTTHDRHPMRSASKPLHFVAAQPSAVDSTERKFVTVCSSGNTGSWMWLSLIRLQCHFVQRNYEKLTNKNV